MQNQYVGDIGDFGKYGLLRAISGDPLRLGVVWYLFPDENDKGDGRFIHYLSNPTAKERNLIECDPILKDNLHKIVIDEKDRRVVRVQEKESGILPTDTLYYDQCLSYEQQPPGASRESARETWLEGALEATAKADVVFVDPDNGITETIEPLQKKGPKYVFMDDLQLFLLWTVAEPCHLSPPGALGQGGESNPINLPKDCKSCLGLSHLPWSLWYHRGTARAYFIVAQERHRAVLEKRLNSFKDSPWCAKPLSHFELVKPSEG